MPAERYGRLTWFAPETFDADQQTLHEYLTGGHRIAGTDSLPRTDPSGRLYGPYNALLASPTFSRAFQEAGNVLRRDATYTPRCREIAILELAALRRCGFEWHAHEPPGRAVGLTDAEIAALRTGAPAPTFDATETLVRRVTQSLARARDLDDALYAQASAALGERALFELVMLVSYFDTLAVAITVFRAELPPGREEPFG
jgi:alkylhydroperoxidase family enzyme